MLTDADESVLAWLSEELDGNYTWDEITKRFNEETGKEVSTATVFRFCKGRGWHEVCDKYRAPPALRLTLPREESSKKFAHARFSQYVQYCGASQIYVKFCDPRQQVVMRVDSTMAVSYKFQLFDM